MSVRFYILSAFIVVLLSSLFYYSYNAHLFLFANVSYERAETAFKDLQDRLQGKSVSMPGQARVLEDGQVYCGDLLGIGSIERGSDSGAGIAGATDKVGLFDLMQTGSARRYLDEVSYKDIGSSELSYSEVFDSFSNELSNVQTSVFVSELQNDLRMRALFREQLSYCEQLYYLLLSESSKVAAEYGKKASRGWISLDRRTE